MPTKSLDGVLTKKAHTKETFTEQQIEDLLACSNDDGYHYFTQKFFYIQHPVKGKLLFEPFEFQTRLLDAYHGHRFNVNMLPRQMGKTTCAAGYLLWYAMFHPDQTVLISAHKFTGSQEIMQRIRYAYELCPDHIRCGVVNYNKGSIEFDNGSRIVSTTTTGNTGRGMSISLLYCDEFEQETGINGFFPFTCKWSEHPDRDEVWERAERGRIGEERFRREYNCEFLIYDETLVSSIKLSELEGIEPIQRVGQTRWYKKLNKESIYAITLDPSLGTGGNNAAIEVFELPSFTQVAEWQHNLTPIQGQIKILREILKYINDFMGEDNPNSIYWTIENNTVGEAGLVCIRDIGEENFPGLFVSEPVRKGHVRKFRKGFNTTHGSKIAAAARLKHLIETNKMTIYSRPLISELKTFIAHGVSFKAKNEEQDDLVSACLLLVRMSQVLGDWDQRVYATINSSDFVSEEDIDMPMPIFISTNM